jgi:hypothetical protein
MRFDFAVSNFGDNDGRDVASRFWEKHELMIDSREAASSPPEIPLASMSLITVLPVVVTPPKPKRGQLELPFK